MLPPPVYSFHFFLISSVSIRSGWVPDILGCEVKWTSGALLSIKLVEVMELQQSYLKSWKMMLSKCRIQYVSKLEKPSSGHRTGKGQSSSQFPRRAKLKNVLTTRQLHSSLMLVRLCSKFCMLGFHVTWTKKFQISKLGLEKAEEPEIKLPTFTGS